MKRAVHANLALCMALISAALLGNCKSSPVWHACISMSAQRLVCRGVCHSGPQSCPSSQATMTLAALPSWLRPRLRSVCETGCWQLPKYPMATCEAAMPLALFVRALNRTVEASCTIQGLHALAPHPVGGADGCERCPSTWTRLPPAIILVLLGRRPGQSVAKIKWLMQWGHRREGAGRPMFAREVEFTLVHFYKKVGAASCDIQRVYKIHHETMGIHACLACSPLSRAMPSGRAWFEFQH